MVKFFLFFSHFIPILVLRDCPDTPLAFVLKTMSKKPKRVRTDELLVLQGLCESRNQAKALIMAGQVRVGTERIDKASRVFPIDAALKVTEKLRYVGRGGLKMENLLKESGLNVQGLHILDIGASTGGFTDCLLQKGAIRATCVDVGHGQLHYRLRTDERVHNLEKTNIRNLVPADIEGSPFPLIVMDLSFISLHKVLSQVWPFVDYKGTLSTLVKPQFECTKKEADVCKGIIRDPEICYRVLDEIKNSAKSNLKGSHLIMESEASPKGTDGNQEYFLIWSKEN